MKSVAAFGTIVLAALVAGCAATGGSSGMVAEDRVIYHINEGPDQASNGLRNINNHLEVNPKAKIVVVSHARGVHFLMKNARDKNGNPYEIPVQASKERGVEFQVCEITLRNRKLKREQFIEEAVFVPSGVGQIGKLQQREGYAYLKP
ncbi:MAG: DsrE family protein [Burkholderiales bacterium]|nr:DsrE family protein [Burkholderiales bacterium]